MVPYEINISPSVPQAFPNLRVFTLQASGLTGACDHVDISDHARRTIDSLSLRGIKIERLVEVEPFRSWRELFAQMGLRPSSFRSSVEALARRVLRNGNLPITGVRMVDVYNNFSVSHLIPMGAYDLAKIHAGIEVRFARDGDQFVPLGGKGEDFPLNARVLVYASGQDVLCFGLNCRDSMLTSLSEETDEALFVAEALDGEQANNVIAALSSLSQLLRRAGAITGDLFEVGVNGVQIVAKSTSTDERNETTTSSGGVI